MHLRYGVLCDYAAPGALNKPTIIGVYEGLYLFIRPDLSVPDFGDYEWLILVDGIRIGSIPFFITPRIPLQSLG